ncbi:hypothetical protein BDU57DRAFT_245502 [Ampelomyces quisqualis]|uniref:Uncharacterized protein n=1 Tax=Ampelomyces quisqualis TaxID=50730 RepID=A0A6A5QM18_AMPQU|nr:hypothetical protein BDU57DRAFT_245502 [Ampelomyces quisqualis]
MVRKELEARAMRDAGQGNEVQVSTNANDSQVSTNANDQTSSTSEPEQETTSSDTRNPPGSRKASSKEQVEDDVGSTSAVGTISPVTKLAGNGATRASICGNAGATSLTSLSLRSLLEDDVSNSKELHSLNEVLFSPLSTLTTVTSSDPHMPVGRRQHSPYAAAPTLDPAAHTYDSEDEPPRGRTHERRAPHHRPNPVVDTQPARYSVPTMPSPPSSIWSPAGSTGSATTPTPTLDQDALQSAFTAMSTHAETSQAADAAKETCRQRQREIERMTPHQLCTWRMQCKPCWEAPEGCCFASPDGAGDGTGHGHGDGLCGLLGWRQCCCDDSLARICGQDACCEGAGCMRCCGWTHGFWRLCGGWRWVCLWAEGDSSEHDGY